MPIYEYECPKGHVTEAFRSMDQRDDAPRCGCSRPTRKIISAVRGFVSFPAAGGQEYVSPTSGKYIANKKQRADDLARTNSRPYEGFESESKAAKKRAKEEEKKQDAKLHDNVSRAFYNLSPKKRKILAQ
jgi:putative FmdB family regulatory protein